MRGLKLLYIQDVAFWNRLTFQKANIFWNLALQVLNDFQSNIIVLAYWISDSSYDNFFCASKPIFEVFFDCISHGSTNTERMSLKIVKDIVNSLMG
jgi:hypothetical protein